MNLSTSASSSPPLSRLTRRRVWLGRAAWAGAAAFLSLAGWWGWRDDAISPANPEPVPPFVVQGLRSFTVRRGGQKLWQFDARQIELSPDGSQTFASDVSNGVLFREGKAFLHLRAPRVELQNTSNDVTARGGVHAKSGNRFAISSPVVRWNYNKKLLSCPLPVKASLRDFSLDAPRLSYDWASGDLSCDAPVELRAPGVRLSAQRLKASTKTRVLDLGGGVSMSFDTQKAHPKEWRDILTLP